MKKLTVLMLMISLIMSNCDEREIDFIQNTQFLFAATLSDDFLIQNEMYDLKMDIRLKDGVLENLTYRLELTINNGAGILLQNGFPFESEGIIDIEDAWTYQPTSLGEQSIVLTLRDNTGASEMVALDVTVGEFIPVEFNFSANFTGTETLIHTDAAFSIELTTDDPKMGYVLNYEVLEGAGEIKNSDGVVIEQDYPIQPDTTKWSYAPTGTDNNRIRLKIKDENGEEVTKNLSILVIDKIPFTITATATPSTIRQSKSSKISISLSSESPHFESLNFTMEYTTNFDSDAKLFDNKNVSIAPNSPVAIDKKDNMFTYKPVVPGTHNITITVSDQKGNSESAVVSVNSQSLQKPQAQATADFTLGTESCIPLDYGNLQGCTRPITLIIDMSGSSDQDEELGGFITDYKITIDDTEYTGEFKPDNLILTINNGQVSYTQSATGSGIRTYSVIHETNAPIHVELRDDDRQWSEVEVISVPGSFPR